MRDNKAGLCACVHVRDLFSVYLSPHAYQRMPAQNRFSSAYSLMDCCPTECTSTRFHTCSTLALRHACASDCRVISGAAKWTSTALRRVCSMCSRHHIVTAHCAPQRAA